MYSHSDLLTLIALMGRGATRLLLVKEIMEVITSIRAIVRRLCFQEDQDKGVRVENFILV